MNKILGSLLLILFALPVTADWEFSEVFVDFDLEISNPVGIQGVAVDGADNIWYSIWGYPTDSLLDANNEYVDIYQIFAKTPEGEDLPFSPISVLTIDGDDYPMVSYGRGMATDPDGNILYSVSGQMYKIDHTTGAGMAIFDYPDYTYSLTKPAVDQEGNVYVGTVGQGNPVYILDSDLQLIGITIQDLSGAFCRAIAVSPNGEELYFGGVWNGIGIRHYHSDLPGVFPHEFVDFIGGWYVEDDSTTFIELWPEDVAYGPDGLLYAANTQIDFTGDEEHGSRWYIYNPITGEELGTFGVPAGDPYEGGVWNGRGIAWSSDASTMYVGDFGYNSVSKWNQGPQSSITVAVESVTAHVGDYCSVPVTLDFTAGAQISSLEIDLSGFLEDLELIGLDFGGSVLETAEWSYVNNVNDGILEIAAAGAEPVLTSGQLFSINLLIPPELPAGMIPIYIGEVLFDNGDLDVSLENGYVNAVIPNPYFGPKWYVSPTGDDSAGNGSSETPFASVQHAIDAAASYDTVLVLPGFYQENINFLGKELLVTSMYYYNDNKENIEQTVIDGGGLGSTVSLESFEGPDAQLYGLSITNGNGIGDFPYVRGGGIHLAMGAQSLIKYCNIFDNITTGTSNRGSGILVNGGQTNIVGCNLYNNISELGTISIGNGNQSTRIDSCTIFDNYDGISIVYSPNTLISNSLIYGNDVFGIRNFGTMGTIIQNCTITANFSGVLNIYENSSAYLVNSIVYDNELHNVLNDDSNGAWSNCHLQIVYSDVQGGADEEGFGEGCIDEDPLFTAPNLNDYTLHIASSCINSGTEYFSMDGFVLVDLDETEFIGILPDMGVYENLDAVGIEEQEYLPTQYILKPNYPNPFNPSTRIRYGLPETSVVKLEIFDILGRSITTLWVGEQGPGWQEYTWDGTDENGAQSAAGIYFSSLSYADQVVTIKMMLLK